MRFRSNLKPLVPTGGRSVTPSPSVVYFPVDEGGFLLRIQKVSIKQLTGFDQCTRVGRTFPLILYEGQEWWGDRVRVQKAIDTRQYLPYTNKIGMKGLGCKELHPRNSIGRVEFLRITQVLLVLPRFSQRLFCLCSFSCCK